MTHPRRDIVRILLNVAKHLFSNRISKLVILLPDEGGAPGICPQSSIQVIVGLDQLVIVLLLTTYLLYRVIAHLFQLHHASCQVAQSLPWLPFWIKQSAVSLALQFVLLFVFATDFFVVTFNRLKSAIGHTFGKQGGGCTQETVAALNLSFADGGRFAPSPSLHPHPH